MLYKIKDNLLPVQVVTKKIEYINSEGQVVKPEAPNGYKFEIITTHPAEIAEELMTRLHRGVTEVQVHGMYSDTDRYMLVCIIHKRQIGEMMKILKSYPDTFASFEKVNEVFGNFKKHV